MKNRFLAAAACVAAFVLFAPRASAADQNLPEFVVTAPDGAQTSTAALQAPGRWLLVYVFPGSSPSDRLVQSLGENWTPDRAARIAFIVAGTPEAAKAYLISKGGDALAADARWFADPQGTAWQALKFQGTLALAGVAGLRVDWKLDGVITDPAVVSPVVEKWLGGGPPGS